MFSGEYDPAGKTYSLESNLMGKAKMADSISGGLIWGK